MERKEGGGGVCVNSLSPKRYGSLVTFCLPHRRLPLFLCRFSFTLHYLIFTIFSCSSSSTVMQSNHSLSSLTLSIRGNRNVQPHLYLGNKEETERQRKEEKRYEEIGERGWVKKEEE